MDEVRYVHARAIRVDGRTILRQEPGVAGSGFYANATDTYYTFYQAPYLFGLDPEEMKINLLTPDRIGEYDMREIAAALGQHTRRTWSWARHRHASPDGSLVAYMSDRRTALAASRTGDLDEWIYHGQDVWLYDRRDGSHRVLTEDVGHVLGWLDDRSILCRGKAVCIVSLDGGVRVVDDSGTGFVLAFNDRLIALHRFGSLHFVSTATLGTVTYRSDWRIHEGPAPQSPDGRYHVAFESRRTSDADVESSVRVVVVDTVTGEAVTFIPVPSEHSPRTIAWLDNDRLIISWLNFTAAPKEQGRKSELSVPGRITCTWGS